MPANRSFGVASTIILALGKTSLRGANPDSSELMALAAVPGNPSNSGDVCGPLACAHAVIYPNVAAGSGGNGGGMRDIHVDAFELANYTVGDFSGQDQSWLRATATDGTADTPALLEPREPDRRTC